MSLQGPVLVRIEEEGELSPAPEVSAISERLRRRTLEEDEDASPPTKLKWLRILFVVLGLAGLGYYGYTLADEHVYQAYQNWAFEQQIAGRTPVTFSDYLREKTALGGLAGRAEPGPAARGMATAPAKSLPVIRPEIGTLLGRIEVPRLNLSAVVREGSDSATLSRAVGHVPSTGLAGTDGNFSIAAHRDTLFRALKDIRKGDVVSFQTPASTYRYQVFSTRIVKPSEVGVLRPDAGLPADVLKADGDPRQLLTMITCYPFSYVGSAPQRFIVTARLANAPDLPAAVASPSSQRSPSTAVPARRAGGFAHAAHHTRISSHLAARVAAPTKSGVRMKRRSLWRKVFRVG